MKWKNIIFFFAVLFIWANLVAAQTSSPQDTLKQYISNLQQNPDDNALREKIIKHVQTMKPKPAMPEEAERFMVRGTAAVKGAKDANDFKDAAREFEKAILAAPWFANAYYNLGFAQDKAGLYGDAIKNLKLYLLAAPNAADTKKVKKLIYEIEYRQEKTQKEKAEKEKEAERKKRAEELLQLLKGVWYGKNCSTKEFWGGGGKYGCTLQESQDKNWRTLTDPIENTPHRFTFTFPGDGTVILNSFESWAGCTTVVGIAEGASTLSEIQWENRPKDGPAKRVYPEINNSGTWLKISCDSPILNLDFDPNAKYQYVIWYRP